MISQDDVYGLILMGGYSTRMGKDKSVLDYHGIPQAEHLFKLVNEILPKTFLSVREDQAPPFTSDVIIDKYDTKGPINGILSAMDQYPGKAWLVLAVDLPFVTERTIKDLLAKRNKSKHATAFATKESGLPEPLVAIWESNASEELKNHHLVEDKRCPRKFMMEHEIELVFPEDDLELYNANAPEEFEHAKKLIG